MPNDRFFSLINSLSCGGKYLCVINGGIPIIIDKLGNLHTHYYSQIECIHSLEMNTLLIKYGIPENLRVIIHFSENSALYLDGSNKYYIAIKQLGYAHLVVSEEEALILAKMILHMTQPILIGTIF